MMPKDGLKAKCPYFYQRADFGREHRIECCLKVDGDTGNAIKPNMALYDSAAARDYVYRRYCVGGDTCPRREYYKALSGKRRHPAR